MQTPLSKDRVEALRHEQGRVSDVLGLLRSLSKPETVLSMTRYGINADKAFGVSVPALRKLARSLGKDHQLAQDLWNTGLHEARELATMVADSKQLKEELMERWVKEIDSWDVRSLLRQSLR